MPPKGLYNFIYSTFLGNFKRQQIKYRNYAAQNQILT